MSEWSVVDTSFSSSGDSENVSMQAKRRIRHFASYRGSRAICKVGTSSGLEGVRAEALSGQIAGRSGADAALLNDPRGPRELRRKIGQRRVDVVCKAVPFEVVANCRIAAASVGEACGPSSRHASVVHEPGAGQGLERLGGGRWSDTGALESLAESPSGHVPPAQSPR